VRSRANAVMHVNDAASEAALVHELEPSTDVAGQGGLAATDGDRYEKEMELIDQARGDRPASGLSTTDGDIRF
jgi:hypothetical protein